MLQNSSDPESQLRKKSNSIAYHFVWEGTAKDEWRCTYERSKDNHFQRDQRERSIVNSFYIEFTQERNQIDGRCEITPICVGETPLRDRVFLNGNEF